MSQAPTPHRFLVESNLEQLESLRGLVAAELAAAELAISRLRERLSDEQDALVSLELLSSSVNGLHRLLIGALDARTGQITDEATGYSRPA